MGQQSQAGRYPVHFHMCGDVDQRGGYREPAYVDGLSIHHSFSRCLTVHATNGLLVGSAGFCWGGGAPLNQQWWFMGCLQLLWRTALAAV